jgi:RND family efflux transporter MFP subunit
MPAIVFSLCCCLLACLPAYAQENIKPAAIQTTHHIFSVQSARRQILLTGFTRARATLDIMPEVTGRCLNITADIGETITEQGIFARIDSSLIRLQLKDNGVKIELGKRTLSYDRQQVKRYQQLLKTKSSSRSRLDELELKRDLSEFSLEQLQIERERLQELLDRHTVKAPSGWMVIERRVEPGQWVQTGTVLARAGDYQSLIVPLAVTPAELRSLQRTAAISLRLPGKNIIGHGSLYHVSPGFDPLTRKIKIEILLDQETYNRLSLKQGGVRVEVPILVPDPMHGFLVPAGAVAERYEEHWLTRKNGSQIRVIVLGPATGPDETMQWLRITSPEISPGDIFQLPSVP